MSLDGLEQVGRQAHDADRTLSGDPLPQYAEPIAEPFGFTPVRRQNSIRRTMSLDAVWPDGRQGPAAFLGICRDVQSGECEDADWVLAQDQVRCMAYGRVIDDLESTPPRPEIAKLNGAKAGGHLRSAIALVLPHEVACGTPLHLLLDNLAGASLVCNFASALRSQDEEPSDDRVQQIQQMAGVCTGFRLGSSALDQKDWSTPAESATRAPPLINPDDPGGWHRLSEHDHAVSFRRARWIDVWTENHEIIVESGFQDSATLPGGGRAAIHEYWLCATADIETATLRSVDAMPGILPYTKCRSATANIVHLLGGRMADLRDEVLNLLLKTEGCTHLNDAMRALAEVPILAAKL